MLTYVNPNKVGGGLLFKSTCIAALLLGTALTPAHADELSELKAQIRAMKAASAAVEKRLVRLEKSKTAKSGNNNKILAATGGPGTEAPALVTSAYPGFITVPGTDTSIKIGGYVKIDGTYDARGGGLGGIGSDFRDIYLSGTAKANRAGDFQVGARQTNLTLSTISPTAYGDVKTFIKADLYGAPNGNAQYSNSYTPRLYQAFITANLAGGTVEVGQDWSTFMDLDSYPETIDFGGPVGVSFVRQPQLRYTMDVGGGSKLYVAAESAYSDFEGASNYGVFSGSGDPSTNIINPLPDFVAKYTYDAAWGHFAISGVGRYIKANTGGAIVNNFTGQSGVYGGGGLVGLVVKTVGLDSIQAEGIGGPGIGRYLFGDDDSNGSGASLANCNAAGVCSSIKATTSYGGTVGYQHYWTPSLRSDVVGGIVFYDNEFPNDPLSSTKRMISAHANLIWAPTAHTEIGIEYLHGYLAVAGLTGAGGQSNNTTGATAPEGSADRVLVSAKYGF